MGKPAQNITRKRTGQPSRVARRPASKPPSRASGPSDLTPRFTRVTGTLEVSPPKDCCASAILRQVARGKHRYFAIWLLVGRYDHEAMSVKYKFTGEDAVRCDIPIDAVISAAKLQPHLARFLKAEGTEPDPPPVIIGKGGGANP